MAETSAPEEAQEITQQFELERADLYGRYLLHDETEVLAVLRAMIGKGALISVHFDHGKSFLLTSMIALANDNRAFIVDFGSDAEMNARALLAEKLVFTTVLDKVKVQFSVKGLAPARHDDRDAFLGAVPGALLRLQRREYFRLPTPIATPLTMTATVSRSDGSALVVQIPLADISGGGVGLIATPEQATLLERGDTLSDCRIVLPDEGLLIATLSVRNLFETTARNGHLSVRVGCEYVDLPPPRRAMVQRYITRVERERKARQSGLA